jgi:hypothetical protein
LKSFFACQFVDRPFIPNPSPHPDYGGQNTKVGKVFLLVYEKSSKKEGVKRGRPFTPVIFFFLFVINTPRLFLNQAFLLISIYLHFSHRPFKRVVLILKQIFFFAVYNVNLISFWVWLSITTRRINTISQADRLFFLPTHPFPCP